MPRVETRGSENEEESKQRCVTYRLENFNFPSIRLDTIALIPSCDWFGHIFLQL